MRTNRIHQIHGLRNDTRALGLSTSKHGLIHAAASPLCITPSRTPNRNPPFVLLSIMSTTEQSWGDEDIPKIDVFLEHLQTLDPNKRTIVVDPSWLPRFRELAVSLISRRHQLYSLNLNACRNRYSPFRPSNTRNDFEMGS